MGRGADGSKRTMTEQLTTRSTSHPPVPTPLHQFAMILGTYQDAQQPTCFHRKTFFKRSGFCFGHRTPLSFLARAALLLSFTLKSTDYVHLAPVFQVASAPMLIPFEVCTGVLRG